MEKSISNEVEPVQGLKTSAMFTFSCGFALYWACFFTMLMRNSFMDTAIEELWYHLYLRIVFLVGSAIACIVIARCADWFSSEKGCRLQKAGVGLFSVVAASASFTAYKFGSALPLAFDCVAWGLAGVGLSCLLMIWIEPLAAFKRKECVISLTASMALGAVAYLAMNLFSFPFNIASLCLLPLASLGIANILEKDTTLIPPAFIPLEESRKRAKLAPFFKGLSIAYGIVFGLGVGSTTQIQGSDVLYSGIAVVLAIGAGTAFITLRNRVDLVQRINSLRFLFPVLIIALIPMSFLQGLPSTACNILLLGCFAFFDATDIELAMYLAQRYKASRLHLVGSSQACLYIGLALGHTIGLVATYSGVMDYAMLSMVALGLVVVLAIAITFSPVSPLVDDSSKKQGMGFSFGEPGDDMPPKSEISEDNRQYIGYGESALQSGNTNNSNGLENAASESKSLNKGSVSHPGKWKARCEQVAKDAGLSARETEVFMLLAKGRGIEHIQNKLCISGHTVKTHVYNIYRKMEINSREELLDAIEARS